MHSCETRAHKQMGHEWKGLGKTQMGFHCHSKQSYIDYAEHKSVGGK